jgi:ribosomal-protein-alanine N-acetyltransferase
MIKRDMSEVLAIETASFWVAWSEDDFLRCLRQRNCIGMVAEEKETVRGFMIYELHKSNLQILNFAVGTAYRRQGVGAGMLDKLKGKLTSNRRTAITLEVKDTNLGAQLFFSKQGFKATGILAGHYEDGEDTVDAYSMRYLMDGVTEGNVEQESILPHNRISQYTEEVWWQLPLWQELHLLHGAFK